MLPHALVTSLSAHACKIYLLLLAAAQGRQVTAAIDGLAADARISERAARSAVQELLGARIIQRFPRHYHTPSTYLISTPSDTGKTPPTNRHPGAGLLTPSAAFSRPSIPLQTFIQQQLALCQQTPTNRHPDAALLTPPAALENRPAADPDIAFLDAFEAIPLEIRQAAFQQLPEDQRLAIIAEAQAALARLDAAEAAQS